MNKKISKHIKSILYDKKYDDDYKQEMINVCIQEYQNALKKGLSKNDAYLYAIKDFDSEYSGEIIKEKINTETLYLPLGISALLIVAFLLCSQFISEEVFIWSIWVFCIPNLLFLFIYNSFNLLVKKYGVKTALFNILLTLLLYFPFILIEIKGNKYDFNNYIIAFTFCIFIGVLFYIIKSKSFSIKLLIELSIPFNILVAYYVTYNGEHIIEFILKILIMAIFTILCFFHFKEEKFNFKKVILSIVFLIIISLFFYSLGGAIQIYSKHIILSIALIIFSFILNCFNVKIIKNYSFIVYVYILYICITTICKDISVFCRSQLMATMNYQFLVSNVIFLVLILLQEYLHRTKYEKGVED